MELTKDEWQWLHNDGLDVALKCFLFVLPSSLIAAASSCIYVLVIPIILFSISLICCISVYRLNVKEKSTYIEYTIKKIKRREDLCIYLVHNNKYIRDLAKEGYDKLWH